MILDIGRLKLVDVVALVVSILVCQSAGVVGALFTSPAIPTWYQTLKKPAFAPPTWVFAPVWITLFLLMGISLFLVWRAGFSHHQVRVGIAIFALQLVVNIAWSAVFFGARSVLGGLIVIVVLWVLILLTIVAFWKVSTAAAYLLIPYLVWVTVATVLNYSIWSIN